MIGSRRKTTPGVLALATCLAPSLTTALSAQGSPGGTPVLGDKRPEWMVAAASLAAPAPLRDGAEVRAWTADGHLVTLRPGSNGIICLADKPDVEGFHAACYHESLEPFMERGRALTREGVSAAARNEVRWREIEAGTLPMPVAGAVYNLSFADDDFDPQTTDPATGSRLHALYMSGATQESTGLPLQPYEGPWLMLPGTPSAHVMMSLPTKTGG